MNNKNNEKIKSGGVNESMKLHISIFLNIFKGLNIFWKLDIYPYLKDYDILENVQAIEEQEILDILWDLNDPDTFYNLINDFMLQKPLNEITFYEYLKNVRRMC